MLRELLLEGRRVDADEALVGDALLGLDLVLELLVALDVRLEGGERAVRLGVAPHEGVLVHVPDVLVAVPGGEHLVHLGLDARHARDDLVHDLDDVVVAGDHLEEVLVRRIPGTRALGVHAQSLREPRHHGDDGDGLAAHRLDGVLEARDGGHELDAVAVEHRVDAEEGLHVRARVAVDGAGELLQGLLHRGAQRLLELLVHLVHEAHPLRLHLHAVVPEHLEGAQHGGLDLGVGRVQGAAHRVRVGALLVLELHVVVDLLLLDVHEHGGADGAACAGDLLLGRLEVEDEVAHVAAVLAALADVLADAAARPLELAQARRDLLVQEVDALLEEPPLLAAEHLEDGVVVAHHEHHVLAHHAEALLVRGDLHGHVGDLVAQLLPVGHLVEEADEHLVEVLLERAPLAVPVALHERRVQVALEHGLGANHERVLEVLGQARLDGLDPIAVAAADVLLQR
mmetsp:Transcript_17841/g.51917  ORF Transcript_17841/g.51917 Transcript_17841/m.51917 type:complete len:456 (-) Transcript_17841:140-1507(-)